MDPQQLVRAIAYLTALDRYSVAEHAATTLPEWLDVLDVIRAADGATQLARELDARRRRDTAA